MIREDEVYRIGLLTKTHGVSGELCMTFTDDVFDRVEAEYLICRMDGILVPFFMEEYRFKNDTAALVKFEGIDTEAQARRMAGVEVYFPKSLAGDRLDGEYTWSYFTGFTVVDVCHGELGIVDRVDDTTMNVLFEVVTPSGDDLLIPVSEELIDDIDHKNRKIYMTLPDGLLDLDGREE
ncbi:MAG: ribosome maturation factor RimM [Paraprevotella sp.]|nr:ribosome maturation factor RimM [Paraprevotella sp.]